MSETQEKKETAQLNPQELAIQLLFQNYTEKYQSLSGFVKTLNLPHPISLFVSQHLDTAHLWVKEGFMAVIAQMSKAPAAPEVPPTVAEIPPDAA